MELVDINARKEWILAHALLCKADPLLFGKWIDEFHCHYDKEKNSLNSALPTRGKSWIHINLLDSVERWSE